MSRLAFLLTALALCSAASAADRPNVVFILADDLGWTDLAVQGSKYYETPNIDRLASQGLRFTSGYTCGPNCQPTRAALMSGQYGPRTGVYTVGSIDRFDWQTRPLRPVDNVTKLAPEIVTVGESMKAAGYATGYFGKWHLGDDPEHHPSAQGFDEAIVSAGQHFDFNTNPKTPYPKGTYLADFLTEKAIGFIREHKAGPFYLHIAHFGVHSPYQAKDELIAKFKPKPGVGGHDDPTYAAMIASVDESVGRVMATLDELGLAENTLVVFTADNGGVGGYESVGITGKNGITNNAPLRGGKGTLYEGGVRVAYMFRWPGQIEAGATTDRPINSVDLYPTLLELTGAPKPNQPLDGESYLAVLRGKDKPRSPLYWHFPGYLGASQNQWRTTPVSTIRDGDWKLMEFLEDGHTELYNLRNDLSEKNNLVATDPDRAAALRAKLAKWRDSVGAKLPTKNDQTAKPKKKPNRRNRAANPEDE
jgi:arylsulfatase A-like enzyme